MLDNGKRPNQGSHMAALIREEQVDEYGQPTKQCHQVKWKIKNTKTMAVHTNGVDNSDNNDDDDFSASDSDQESVQSSQSDIEMISNDEVCKFCLHFLAFR